MAPLNLKVLMHRAWPGPALGAVVAVLCGLAAHWSGVAEDAGYDALFLFGRQRATNCVLLKMDNASYEATGQSRTNFWDRRLHAALLDKLTEAGAKLVVFDVLFEKPAVRESDDALAAAIRRQGHVLLTEVIEDSEHPAVEQYHIIIPWDHFATNAAGAGVGRAQALVGMTPRKHWPFPSIRSGERSLPEVAAEACGVTNPPVGDRRWLHYYGEKGAWKSLSYYLATNQSDAFFSNQVVFIGSEPESPDAHVDEKQGDKYRTPYTRWTGRAVGGVEIMATTYLNLVRRDWLRRPPAWMEECFLVLAGTLLGAGLCLPGRMTACGAAAAMAALVATVAVSMAFYLNYWFDWLPVAAIQAPCALAFSFYVRGWRVQPRRVRPRDGEVLPPPVTGEFELWGEPFGKGAYGRVWLARNAVGQWQALKAVYLSGFEGNAEPYEREFNGIRNYKPLSGLHSGLLRVDFVSSQKPEGYFYYVMELGDSLVAGWEDNPSLYQPCDLEGFRHASPGGRLAARDCVRIGIHVAEALEFLHSRGKIHRDIKPRNIVFVGGAPKLADIGLIAPIRTNPMEGTHIGTPGYMPPAPEPPGTPQADIFGLGMVLYVIWTGRDPDFYPAVSTTLVSTGTNPEFRALNALITKACHPDCSLRFATARELSEALRELDQVLGGSGS